MNSFPSASVTETCASKSRGWPKERAAGSRSLKSAVISSTMTAKGASEDSSTSGPGAHVSYRVTVLTKDSPEGTMMSAFQPHR